MENDFQIKLSAIVDLTSIDTQIQNHFNSKKFKINVEANVAGATAVSSDGTVKGVDASKITKAENAARDLQTRLNNLFNTTKIGKDEFKDFNQRLQAVQASFSKTNNLNTFSKELNKLKNEISETSTKFIKATEAQNENYAAQGRQEKRLNQINNQYKSFKQALSNAYVQGQLNKKQYSDMSALLKNNYKAYHDAVDGITEYGSQEKDLISASTQWNNSLKDQRNVLSGLKADYQAHSQDLTKIIGKYLKWYSIATVVSLVINSIKKLVAEVKNLDKAMTELNKVTDVSQSQLEAVKKQAFEIGEVLGRTGKEVIDATTEFARMGYSLQESLELSKVAVMMTNVAEGITDTGEAAEKLISILKGIGVGSGYAMSLLDRLNNVANKNAISFDKLADMLQTSAATMNILGNNLDETIALLTAGFEVLQDEKVATGLQTIGLRIAGLNEDLEEEAGLANDVSRALEKYAGISVWDKETGALKNTYTILSEVAEKWDEIGEQAGYQESLLNILAGKRQANVAGAIINNFDAISKVMDDLKNSAGSAARENEVYLDSIEGHINVFKNTFQEMADLIIGSDIIKTFVDIGTALVGIVGIAGRIISLVVKVTGIELALKGISNVLIIIFKVADNIMKSVERFFNQKWIKDVANFVEKYLMFGWLKDVVASTKTLSEVQKDIAETYENSKKQVNEYENSLNKLIIKMKNLISIEDKYDEELSLADKLSLIKKENEQTEKQKALQEKILNVEKARLELAQARNKQVRVFRAGRGFVYESDESEMQSAQENLVQAVNELSEYKYEIALERAEQFIEDFGNLVKEDKSQFLSGWEKLFEEYGDLLDTEFSSYIQKAKEYVDEFKDTFDDLDKEQSELVSKSALSARISELELERMEYAEGSDQYKDLTKRITNLQQAYNKLVGLDVYGNIDQDALAKEYKGTFLPGLEVDDEGNSRWNWGEFAKGALIPGYEFFKQLGWKWFANGTDYAPGGVSLVGEEGPELVSLPTGARVNTASETRSILGSLKNSNPNSGTVFNVGTVEISEPNNFDGFVSQFCTKLNVPNPVKLST